MIQFNKSLQQWEATCDECPDGSEEVEGSPDAFREFVAHLKEQGWTVDVDPKTQEWVHSCSDCS